MFNFFNCEKLIPGNGGRDCPGNGYGKKECACDECDYFLCCFPEYKNIPKYPTYDDETKKQPF